MGEWPRKRPGLRFGVLKHKTLIISRDTRATIGLKYQVQLLGKIENCYIISIGYEDKITKV